MDTIGTPPPTADPGKLTAQEAKRVDAWISQYALCKAEIAAQIGYYKMHVRNFQLLLGAIVGAAAFVAAHPDAQPTSQNRLLWALGVVGIPIVATYLALDVIGPFYIVNLTAERMVTIEWSLNTLLGPRVYVTERYCSPVFYRGPYPLPGLTNPDAFLWAFGALLYITLSAAPLIWLCGRLGALADVAGMFTVFIIGLLVIASCLLIMVHCTFNVFTARTAVRPFMSAIADSTTSESDPLRSLLGVSRRGHG
ncbi:MAG TPA: hypothetical protein VGS57_19200 [Thermoanaerobaculia bacterium]|jgi:hypothetical protein|nr:hypothetical protein [Thermoanaerobaculia bacterium]